MLTVALDRSEALQVLIARADRARAQAMANHDSLARTMTRANGLHCRLMNSELDVRQGDAGAHVRELQETVEGLTKRLESQGPIEQAKGIIMAQNRCSADRAFEILRRASQRSNIKLRVLAEELVARTAKTDIAG